MAEPTSLKKKEPLPDKRPQMVEQAICPKCGKSGAHAFVVVNTVTTFHGDKLPHHRRQIKCIKCDGVKTINQSRVEYGMPPLPLPTPEVSS